MAVITLKNSEGEMTAGGGVTVRLSNCGAQRPSRTPLFTNCHGEEQPAPSIRESHLYSRGVLRTHANQYVKCGQDPTAASQSHLQASTATATSQNPSS